VGSKIMFIFTPHLKINTMKYNISDNGNDANLSINFEGISLESALKIINAVKQVISLSEVDTVVLDLLKTSNLLQAVKYYKEKTNMPLKESKDYCEALAVKYNISLVRN
jgi:hypothetical protein